MVFSNFGISEAYRKSSRESFGIPVLCVVGLGIYDNVRSLLSVTSAYAYLLVESSGTEYAYTEHSSHGDSDLFDYLQNEKFGRKVSRNHLDLRRDKAHSGLIAGNPCSLTMYSRMWFGRMPNRREMTFHSH